MIDVRKWGEYDYIKIPTSQCIDCMQYNTQTTLPKTELTFIGEPIFEKEMEKTSSVSISSNGISIGGIVKDNKLFDDNFIVFPNGVNKGIDIDCLIPINHNEIKKCEIKVDKPNNIIGGKNMNELLNLYKRNKANEITKKYDIIADELLKDDSIVKAAKEYNEKIRTNLLDKEQAEALVIDIERVTESRTKELLKENNIRMGKEILELENFIDTINAHLDMTDTFEQKQEILRAYGIINENGILKKQEKNIVMIVDDIKENTENKIAEAIYEQSKVKKMSKRSK